ncbi:MAG: type IV secretory system conjugative DNA transfer family protein [Sphingomonas sp.]
MRSTSSNPAGDPRLHADAGFVAEALLPLSGSASGQHFELLARGFVRGIMKALVETVGHVSFPSLYRSVNALEADPDYRNALLDAMAASAFEDVRTCGAMIATKMEETPKEFSGVMGTIHNHLAFLADPVLRAMLEQPDFSLEDFTDPARSVSAFINIPIEYVGILSSLLRVMFTVTDLYKSRAPSSPRVTMVVDEAGQLGKFEGLVRGFSFGRGSGLRVIAIFQDLAQIARNYDPKAVQTFMGSAQLRMFVGVRDPETAAFVSNMAGYETLSFDDRLAQEGARRQQWEAARRYMDGGDPLAAAFDIEHYAQAARNRTKMQRALIAPDEALALGDREMIAFLSGLDLPPLRAAKLPYWEQRDLNGYWLPNPFHPPLDRVRLRGRWRDYWADVVTQDVPPDLAQYPQFQSGRVSYVAGHRPW